MAEKSSKKSPKVTDYREKPWGKSVTTKDAQKSLDLASTTISRYILSGKLRAKKGRDGYEISGNDVAYLKEHPVESGRPIGAKTTGKTTIALVNGSTTVTLSIPAFKKLQIIAINDQKSSEMILEEMIDAKFQNVEKKIRNL